MRMDRRHWVLLAVVALLAAVWWLAPTSTSPTQAPSIARESSKPGQVSEKHAIPAPPRTKNDAPGSTDDAPTTIPPPRDALELPRADPTLDAGVTSDDSSSVSEKQDRMLMTVLDRLRADLETAEAAADEEEARRLKIRIERLEARRRELAEP